MYGMQKGRPRSFDILLICLVCLLLCLSLHHKIRKEVSRSANRGDMKWTEAHLACLRDGFLSISPTAEDYAQLVRSVVKEINNCEQRHFPGTRFPIQSLKNKYELKHALLPVRNFTAEERCVVAVLGIGYNVIPETELRALYPKRCEFFGADPDPANKPIFEKINGKYFQGAISGKAGLQTAVLLHNNAYYKGVVANHTALSSFIDFIGHSEVIDWMSIDIEGGEVELFPSLMKNGYFDKINTHICQLDMELHFREDDTLADNRLPIYDFLLRSVVDKRFIFLKGNDPWGREQATYYAINVESERCKRRYLIP